MHKYMFIIIFIGIHHCSKLVSTSDEYRRLVVQNKFDRVNGYTTCIFLRFLVSW